MARFRSTTAELGRLLNADDQPIYVLDDDLKVVFANRAMRRWLGPPVDEQLAGLRCRYHSRGSEGPPTYDAMEGSAEDNRKALGGGLCPPPDVLAGQVIDTVVEAPLPDGRTLRAAARAFPLGPIGEEPNGVVVVLIDTTLPGETDGSGGGTLEPDAHGRTSTSATPPRTDRMPGASPRSSSEVEPDPDAMHQLLRWMRRQAAVRFGADRLIGHSPAMRRVRRQVELAAESDASVLIVGPRGSGRRHTASAIHYRGRGEQAGPLIPLACATLGPELIASTIAALGSGDFSALADRYAPTNEPEGGDRVRGTLLLSDADRIPVEVQRSVAAALGKPSFPLRLIATAGEPLGELACHSRYNQELAVLLGTITIELPPLSARRDDIPLLAQLILEDRNAEGERQLAGFTPEALDLLAAHPWKGNVAELAEVVAAAHARAAGRKVELEDLPQSLLASRDARDRPFRETETIVLDDFLQRIERELIRRALATAKGNKAEAARLLGLTRPRLYRRLSQLGLEG